MWSFLGPRDLTGFQRATALKQALEAVDRQIAEDFAAGDGWRADQGLDRRLVLMGRSDGPVS
jgi:hypothetical protein